MVYEMFNYVRVVRRFEEVMVLIKNIEELDREIESLK